MKFLILLSVLLTISIKPIISMDMGGGMGGTSTGGATTGKDGGAENSTVNVMNESGEVEKHPTMGALVEAVKRDRMYRTISETMSQMKDRMAQMMDNISNRLEQIESAGTYYFYFFSNIKCFYQCTMV